MSILPSTKLITFSQNSNFEDCACDCDCDCDCWKHPATYIIPAKQQTTHLPFSTLTTTYLELTPACNSRCIGCSNVFITDKPTRKMKIAQAPLDIRAWRTIIDKLAPQVSRVSLTGGEPTLYKYFDQFTALLDEYGLNFTLFTNARWPQPQALVEQLSHTKNLNSLLISLHGQDTASHEAFTLIPGSFAETIENIKLATAANIPVTLSTIITRQSYAQNQAIYQLGQELGVQKVVFNRYVGTPTEDCAPTPAQLKQALVDIEQLRLNGAAVKLSVTVPQCFHPSSATGCGAGDSFLTVDPWGNLKPCNHTPMILGNLRYDTLETIQASEQLNYWRNLTPAGCHSCAAMSICGGGCRAEAMLNHNPHDSLIQGPFLPQDKTDFLLIPDYLHPLSTQEFTTKAFRAGIDPQIQDTLITNLNGTTTLKELGLKHGQSILDIIGTMHKEGVVEFI